MASALILVIDLGKAIKTSYYYYYYYYYMDSTDCDSLVGLVLGLVVPQGVNRHMSGRKSYLHFCHFAGEAIVFSFLFVCLLFFWRLILLIKAKLYVDFRLVFNCVFACILHVSKKLNFAQNADATFLHSYYNEILTSILYIIL